MLLAIDIGNTSITVGLFKNNVLKKRYRIPTKTSGYFNALKKIFAANRIDAAILCSVVPESTKRLAKELKKFLNKETLIVGKDLTVPVKNLYRLPKQVGQDRLVNAYAAVKLYGSPAVIIDFGTAITFDGVSKKGEYLGGMILPGIEISLDALWQKTALLPKVKLEKPREFIGRDTKESILSGLVHGFAALTDGMARRMKKEIGKNCLVIGTGGNISFISKFLNELNHKDIDLTLKGLNLIYQNNR
ncbi:MAG: type III pantothenate kinase [Candidatus Omnitrophica bacterium]|nr:type III pantothenate kinase [Candidatus Omnitrophota bacterium]